MPISSPQRIAILIPAYNEATQIRRVVENVKKALSEAKLSCDVIVIDDGSTDATASQAVRGGAIVVRHILNSGVGSATATALQYARQNAYNTAVTMDADGQHLPVDVVKGLEAMHREKIDLLIGSRLIDPTGMTWVKQLGNKGLSLITFLLFHVRVTDSQSGLRLFSERALKTLHWRTSGYEFCSEMLWRAKQSHLRIGEYPIQAVYTDYSRAKGQNNWNAFYLIKSLLQRRILEIIGE